MQTAMRPGAATDYLQSPDEVAVLGEAWVWVNISRCMASVSVLLLVSL